MYPVRAPGGPLPYKAKYSDVLSVTQHYEMPQNKP